MHVNHVNFMENGHYMYFTMLKINSSNSSSKPLILLIRKSSTAYSHMHNSLQTVYPSVYYSNLLNHHYHKSIISAWLV